MATNDETAPAFATVGKRLAFLLLLGALVWLCSGLAARMVAHRLLFPKQAASYALSDEYFSIPVRGDEKIAALYLPGSKDSATVLYLHGNASDLGRDRGFLNALNEQGYGVLAIDYRGFGCSQGDASESSANDDARVALAWLGREKGISPDRVLVFGYSLGGGPATKLAAENKLAGLVLQSAFSSAFGVRSAYAAKVLAPFDVFKNEKLIGTATCPVWILQGANDSVVSLDHGMALYRAAREPRRLTVVPGAGHDDLLVRMGPSFWREFARFAKR